MLATANTLLCGVNYLTPGAKHERPSHTFLIVPALLALSQAQLPSSPAGRGELARSES